MLSRRGGESIYLKMKPAKSLGGVVSENNNALIQTLISARRLECLDPDLASLHLAFGIPF